MYFQDYYFNCNWNIHSYARIYAYSKWWVMGLTLHWEKVLLHYNFSSLFVIFDIMSNKNIYICIICLHICSCCLTFYVRYTKVWSCVFSNIELPWFTNWLFYYYLSSISVNFEVLMKMYVVFVSIFFICFVVFFSCV